jgi:hypothetical protein
MSIIHYVLSSCVSAAFSLGLKLHPNYLKQQICVGYTLNIKSRVLGVVTPCSSERGQHSEEHITAIFRVKE